MMVSAAPDYQSILVATDFSAHAEAALKQAMWLARQTGARITLAHALPDLRRAVHTASYKARLDLFYGEGNVFQREIRQEADARMRRQISELNGSDLNIKVETLLGTPFVELTHSVQQEGHDLVIAGSRGHAAWEQFFVGSTAARLIRKCPASVWIAKQQHIGAPKTVLAATDFSEVSVKALKQALLVAEKAAAEFHVLHVADSEDVPDYLAEKITDGPSLREQVRTDARSRLESLVKTLAADQDHIQIHFAHGTPWREIRQSAQQVRADLIVLGTVGRSGINGILLGNTAEKVLQSCDCSILTVKPDGFVSPISAAWWPLHPDSDVRPDADDDSSTREMA